MDRSPGFGSAPADSRAVNARSPSGSGPEVLNLAGRRNSPDRSTKSTRSYLFSVLPQLVNTGFQVLFHSPPGVLFTFPSQYSALSVTKEYLALRGGPRSFPQGFTCLVVLWILLCRLSLRLRGSHPVPPVFPVPFCWDWLVINAVRTPECTHSGLGSFPFARRYLGNHCCFLLLRLLRCFSSPGSPRMAMDSPYGT